MTQPSPRDYTRYAFYVSALVIVFLVCVSFVPGFHVGSLTIKRANILSDVVTFREDMQSLLSSEDLLDTSFVEEFDAANGAVQEEPAAAEAVPVADTVAVQPTDPNLLTVPVIADTTIVQIEDFSPDEQMLARFYHALAYETGSRPVRIAVLGDSFIEADIITADLREQLQVAYGGRGVGFVPFSTPLSKYRGTVSHTHEGWTDYNLIKRKSVPEAYKDRFFVSGMLSVPADGAYTQYKGVQFRKRIEQSNTATLFFRNGGDTELTVTVNDAPARSYRLPAEERVQCLSVETVEDIASLRIDVAHPAEFIGYGVVMEDSVGVSVHNYSVRSNSGLALLGTDYETNRQMNDYLPYDMVILQYGLNAMSPDVMDYGYYGKQLVKIISYIQRCFPESAVVVMSVGDRSTMQNGTAVTMPAVHAMLQTQEAAARACGVGFWNTYKAMGGDNSMPKFVERHWAAKDYTHIGYPGGKYIAEQFVRFLNAAVASVRQQDAERQRIEEQRARIEAERAAYDLSDVAIDEGREEDYGELWSVRPTGEAEADTTAGRRPERGKAEQDTLAGEHSRRRGPEDVRTAAEQPADSVNM